MHQCSIVDMFKLDTKGRVCNLMINYNIDHEKYQRFDLVIKVAYVSSESRKKRQGMCCCTQCCTTFLIQIMTLMHALPLNIILK